MRYREAVQYLTKFVNYERWPLDMTRRRAFNLERVKYLLARLGDPQKGLRYVHVAGTNGKGATACIIARLAETHGYRTGLYTSPHVLDLRERIQINGQWISKSAFGKGIGQIRAAVEETPWPDAFGLPTYFEMLTALAFLYFRDERVDLAVLEVGLGGRFDATNVIRPLVSVFTPISLDHQHVLGNSIAEIAAEKACIIKKGVLAFSAPQKVQALHELRTFAREQCAPLEVLPALDAREFGRTFTLNLVGSYQTSNARLALRVYQSLGRYGFRFQFNKAAQAFRTVAWPCRFEIIQKNSMIVLDGAHNVGAMEALISAVRSFYKKKGKILVIFGACKDKDIESLAKTLGKLNASFYLTEFEHERSEQCQRLRRRTARFFGRRMRGLFHHPKDALRYIQKEADRNDLVLVTGSLFLASEARRFLCRR